MKKIRTFALSLAAIYLFSFSTYATNYSPDILPQEAKYRVNSLLQAHDSTSSIEASVPLYDNQDDIVAWGIHLNPTGYIIIDANNSFIIEYSLQNTAPFSGLDKIYYAGPLQYYKKKQSEFVSVRSNESYNYEELSDDFDKFRSTLCSDFHQEFSQNRQARILTTHTIPGELRKYSYNPNGICGSTAAAIFLMYYRDYPDSWMVPSWHDTEDGISLIKLLEPNIDGSVPGSTTEDMVYGLNWYFRWRGISSSYQALVTHSAPFSSYRPIIDSDRPVIVDLNAHPTYGEHWVVGYGYTIEPHLGNTYYYIVANDGWGSNGVEISMKFVGDIVYLNK